MTTNKLNQARVAELHSAMNGYIERGDVPGIVTLIACGEEIHVDAVGMKTADGKEPMRRDSDLQDRVDHEADRCGSNDDSGRRW